MEAAVADWRRAFGNVSKETALAKQDELIRDSRRKCDKHDQLRGQVARATSAMNSLRTIGAKSMGRNLSADDAFEVTSAILDVGLQSRGGLRLVKKHRATLARVVSKDTEGRWIVIALSEL